MAGVEMARFLLSLSDEDFAQYKAQDLHVVPTQSLRLLSQAEQSQARAKGIETRADDYQMHNGARIEDIPIAADDPEEEPLKEESPTAGESSQENPFEDAEAWHSVRQVVEMIIEAPDARFEALCFRINAGYGDLDNITTATVARKYEKSERAVSRHCDRQVKRLGIDTNRYAGRRGRKAIVDEGIRNAWFAIGRIVDVLISKENTRLEAECFLISSGLGDQGDLSESSLGRKYGMTRAAVSKRCKAHVRLLGLKPSQFMRPKVMCEKYRKARFRSLKKKSAA